MKKHSSFKRLLKGVIVSSALVVSSAAVAGYGGLIFTPVSGNFGSLPLGSTSGVQLFTATVDFLPTVAPGVLPPLTINTITLPAGYVLNGGTCPIGSLSTSGCTIGIQFRPTLAGIQAGNIVVNATALGSTQDNLLPVTGQGITVSQLPANNSFALGALLASLALAGMIFSRRR